MLNVPIPNIFETLSINLGTAYVNDFNAFGRVYQVRAQADQAVPHRARRHPEAEGALGHRRAGAARHAGRDPRRRPGRRWCSATTCMSRCRCRATPRPASRPATALDTMEEIAAETLPPGTSFEWTELALQETQTGNTAIFIFGLSVLFVFLALAAQYESWILPFAIILIVPLGVLAALHRRHLARARQQHPVADRADRADRPCGQERDPDRRVRPAGAGARR